MNPRDALTPDQLKMADGPRTVTAAATKTPASCEHCGRTEPRKDLWGIAAVGAGGLTTADIAKVDHWCCSTCFALPANERPKGASREG